MCIIPISAYYMDTLGVAFTFTELAKERRSPFHRSCFNPTAGEYTEGSGGKSAAAPHNPVLVIFPVSPLLIIFIISVVSSMEFLIFAAGPPRI